MKFVRSLTPASSLPPNISVSVIGIRYVTKVLAGSVAHKLEVPAGIRFKRRATNQICINT